MGRPTEKVLDIENRVGVGGWPANGYQQLFVLSDTRFVRIKETVLSTLKATLEILNDFL